MPVDMYLIDGEVADPSDIKALEESVAERLQDVFGPYMGVGTVNVPNALEYVDIPVTKCIGAKLDLYVTGLTSVALEAVKFCFNNSIPVSAWHYDRETGKYVEQVIFPAP